jgi:predicted RNase H-like HicB family nuclease
MQGIQDMRNLSVRVEIFKEGDVYVALSPELNVSSFGETVEEAKSAIKEAIEAFIEECEKMGTLDDVLEEAGFTRDLDMWVSRVPIVQERIALAM